MDKVFHFTSYEALKYIIRDNAFRVSSVNLMNDIEEFQNMQQIKNEDFEGIKRGTVNQVKKICEECFGTSFFKKINIENIGEILDINHNSIFRLNEIKTSCYIASFSSIPDEYKDRVYNYIVNVSSMWSHYAKKYDGVAIVFNQKNLNTLFKKSLKQSSYELLSGRVKYEYCYDYNFFNKKNDIDILKEKYFTKNFSWNIENEYRYLFYNKNIKLKKKEEYLYFKGIIGCIDAIIISGDINKYKETFKKIMEYKLKVYQFVRNYNSNSAIAIECTY